MPCKVDKGYPLAACLDIAQVPASLCQMSGLAQVVRAWGGGRTHRGPQLLL